jgi:hypothetical protein
MIAAGIPYTGENKVSHSKMRDLIMLDDWKTMVAPIAVDMVSRYGK